MAAAPTIPLVAAQLAAVAHYFRENPEVAQVYGLAAADPEQPTAPAANDVLCRVYHLSPKPTPDAGYDDRLTMRLKCSSDTAYSYVNTPPASGGLRCKRLGKRITVTEKAVREFMGDEAPASNNK
jgi:hypothetical protein